MTRKADRTGEMEVFVKVVEAGAFASAARALGLVPSDLIVQAVVTMDSAQNRTESRGAHAREDYPDRDDQNWMKHSLAFIDPEEHTVRLDDRPVHAFTLTNDVQYIEPKARVY